MSKRPATIRPAAANTCAACGRERKASDLFLVPYNDALVVVCQACLELEGQADFDRALRTVRRGQALMVQ